MAIIRVKNGPLKGTTYNLEEESITIGRDEGIGIQILDQGVSRRHAEMFRIGEMYFIRDLSSRNGTFVNEEKVTEELLRVGDEVKIGTTILRFEDKVGTDDKKKKGKPTASGRMAEVAPELEITTTTIRLDIDGDADDPVQQTEESRDLQVLYKVAKTVASERDVQPLAEKVAKLAVKAVSAEHGYIFVKRPEHKELELIASYERSKKDKKEKKKASSDPVVSKGIIRRVTQFGRAVMSSDASLDDRFKDQGSVVLKRIRSVICAPLVAMDQLLGVVYLSTTRVAEAFDTDDLELIVALGVQAGMAIQGIMLAQAQEKSYLAVVRALTAAVEMRDPDERGHSERVATYASAISTAMGIPRAENRRIQLAALLHNLGNLLIRADEAESLEADELQRQRLELAEKLIKRMSGKQWLIPPIKYHCERWDGTGIPEGLKGEDIPLPARIIGVAKDFEGLLSQGMETGKELTTREAIDQITANAGTRYDPDVVNALGQASDKGMLFNPDDNLMADSQM